MTIQPTFLADYAPATQPCVGTGAQTISVTVQGGDTLVVFGATESNTVTLATPSGGGLTYLLQVQSTPTASRDNTTLWTAAVPTSVITPTTFTLTVTPVNAVSTTRWTVDVLRFSNVGAIGAVVSGVGAASAPSLSLTTTQAYSAIVFGASDFLAVDGASRVWNTSTAGAITEDNYDRAATFITDYLGHYSTPGPAGAETVGLTSPSGQQWSAVALELIGLAGSARVPGTNPTPDTTSLTDATSVVRTSANTPADTTSLTGAVLASLGFNNTPADTTSLTDTVLASRQTSKADATSLTDAVSVVKTVASTVADAMLVHDTGGSVVPNPNADPNLGRLVTDNSIIAVLVRPDIVNHQFMLEASPWCPFGHLQSWDVAKFDPGTAAIRGQDVPGGLSDVAYFGVDRHTPSAFTWDLFTDSSITDESGALGWLDLLAQVWDHDVRRTPNGALALRYCINNRIRRVYGRPRRFTPIVDTIQTGKAKATVDFALSESETFYDDTLQTVTVPITASVVKGTFWTFPIVWPLALLTPGTARTGQMIIGGTQKTWILPTFRGPCSNPWLQVGNRRWQLNGTIAAGDSLTLSGRPWDLGIRTAAGVAHPEFLDPRARLSQLRLSPGTYTVTFGGIDLTTTSSCVVAWRNAYRSL